MLADHVPDGVEPLAARRPGAQPGGLAREAGGSVAVACLDAVPDGCKALGRNIFLAAPGVRTLLNDGDTFELGHGRHCTVYRDRQPSLQGGALPALSAEGISNAQSPPDPEAVLHVFGVEDPALRQQR